MLASYRRLLPMTKDLLFFLHGVYHPPSLPGFGSILIEERNSMKKWILPFIVTGVFTFGSAASASELNSTNPGVTPDQLLYSVDQLIEGFQLYLTTNSEKETEILLELAKERLAEAQVMTDEEKLKFINNLMKNYVEKLALAEELMAKLIIEDKLSEETVLELEKTTEEVIVLNEELEEILSDDLQEELENQQASLKQLPAVVQNLDEEVVFKLREQGLGFGQIAQIYILSEASGTTVDEISNLFIADKKGFGEAAKELGLHPSEINKNKKTVNEVPTTDQEETVDSEVPTVAVDTDESAKQVVTTSLTVQSKGNEKPATPTTISTQKTEEAKARAEEAKKQADLARLATEQKKAEEARKIEEQRKADETKKNQEVSNQQAQKANENIDKNKNK